MAQGAMSAAKPLAITLSELRALARQRRSARVTDAAALLIRLLGACRTLVVEERAPGLAFRLAGETEQLTPFGLTCILHSASGAPRLTLAERAVADLLCEGHTLAQIARLRGVTANTVKSQVRQVFRKLNVDSRVALARRWCP
jgi:DNA-binding CsgD family transcriptional regulator